MPIENLNQITTYINNHQEIALVLPWVGVNGGIIMQTYNYPRLINKALLNAYINFGILILIIIAVKSDNAMLVPAVVATRFISYKIAKKALRKILLYAHGLLIVAGTTALLIA